MNRYFGFNTLAGAFRSSSSVVEVTTSGRFDSQFVPNGIKVPNNATDYFQTLPFQGGATPTTLWTHFELFPDDVASGANGGIFWYNSGGTNVLRARCVGGGTNAFQFAYWNGSAFVNAGSPVDFALDSRVRWDVKLAAGASGEIKVYKQGAPVLSVSGLNAAVTNFSMIRFLAQSVAAGAGWVYSQILGADEDTRDHRYYYEPLDALGTLTDGSGSVGDVNETVLDESTFAQLGVSGDERSYTHPTFSLPVGYEIGAVVANARGRVQGSGPTDGELGLYDITAATPYLSGGLSYNGGFEPRGYIWDINPDTSAAWTETDYNDVEVIAAAA